MSPIARLLELLLPRWERSNVYVREAGVGRTALPCPVAGLDFHVPVDPGALAPRDLQEVVRHPERWLLQDFSSERLAVVRAGGQVVHRSLLRLRGRVDTEGIRRWATLGAGEAFIHACETAPAVRGSGLYPFVLDRLVAFAEQELHCQRVYISCSAANASSNRGIQKAGFHLRWYTMGLSLLNGRLFLGGARSFNPPGILQPCLRFSGLR